MRAFVLTAALMFATPDRDYTEPRPQPHVHCVVQVGTKLCGARFNVCTGRASVWCY